MYLLWEILSKVVGKVRCNCPLGVAKSCRNEGRHSSISAPLYLTIQATVCEGALDISPEVLKYLYQRKWQGNVRELRNTIKRLVFLAADTYITLADLVGNEKQKLISGGVGYEDLYARPYNAAKAEILKRFSRNYISHLLTSHSSELKVNCCSC